jgi:hypothetical protein
MSGEWRLDQTDSERFPYLLTITENGRVRQKLLVQDAWPAEGKNTFCLRPERHSQPWQCLAAKERVPIKALKARGKMLSVILDRTVRKRCEFLFTEKRYKSGSGTYEQIFWRTQDYFRQRPASIRTRSAEKVEVLIDTQERYPYKFASSRRERLPAGDYGVAGSSGGMLALVERKTFRDFLHSLSTINTLHMVLAELAAYPAAALVVEAPFHYFLDQARLGPYGLRAGTVEQLIMELYTSHPAVHLVFLENRKVAQRWCASFLQHCAATRPQTQAAEATSLAEPPAEYAVPSYETPEEFIRALPSFSFDQLRTQFPDWSESKLRNLLTKYRKQGWLVCRGRGVKACWSKAEDDS